MIVKVFMLLLLLAVTAGAQTPEPPEVHVKLSLAQNKTVYRIGEPIKIVMEFSADREGFLVEIGSDGNDPTSDKIIVSPETAITHWYNELIDNGLSGHDYFAFEKLTSSPHRLEIVLNDSLRFDNPGRY